MDFEEYLSELEANRKHLECPFGCSAYGFLCNGNPYETPCGQALEKDGERK